MKDRDGWALAFIMVLWMGSFLVGILMGERIGERSGKEEGYRLAALEFREKLDAAETEIIVLKEINMEVRKSMALTGKASWYGHFEKGRITYNGEIFDPDAMTSAIVWPLPLNRFYTVTRLDTGVSVVVWANDRIPGRHGRIIDLSRRAASELGMLRAGVVAVNVEPGNRREP